ncbi:hypothetical protein T492DRAFT_987550 [Pavlovales sp. CCMP2436]|nr:hypothetical protein T492DRAFT_987550 [Pavlovales sp. CCMP2436]
MGSRHCGRICEIRAVYSTDTVRVYQAYNHAIADAAIAAQAFVAPWSNSRMTWVKPSFVWMGYRCGWASKDANQARVLAVDLHRGAFDEMLRGTIPVAAQPPRSAWAAGSCDDIVVQWDPERALGGACGREGRTHQISGVRSLQMGVRGTTADRYGRESIAMITDVTELFRSVGELLECDDIVGATSLLQTEAIYPLPAGCVI